MKHKHSKNCGAYATTYCNRGHRLCDGMPIEHECRILPPAAIQAEMAGDYAKANDLIQAGKTQLFYGMRELPIAPRGCKNIWN